MTITTPNIDLSLYAWQSEALDAWRANNHHGDVEAVTGTGKTRLAVAAIAEAYDDGQRSVVLVPSVALQDQWVEVIHEHLPHLQVGRWGNGRHDDICDVIVAVVNTAVRRRADLHRVGLLVADEVHRYGAAKHRKALVPAPRRLGLTATLERSDEGVDRVLKPFFGAVVFEMGYGRALADGVVSRFTVDLVAVDFAQPSARATYDRLTTTMEETRTALVGRYGYPMNFGAFMDRVTRPNSDWQSREANLSRDYVKAFVARRDLLASDPAKVRALSLLAPAIRASGRCLVFTETKTAADACARALLDAGVGAAAIHSGLSAKQRQQVIGRFRTGDLHALVAPKLLDEGVDLPDADLGIVVSASRSRRQMIQRMGRILRPKPDGRHARLIVLYVQGTGEDPATGAHEAFLGQVLPYAEDVVRR